ncbi:MAG: hypothetical protein ACFE0J_19790 [Elainellaceae cyanobacterium]
MAALNERKRCLKPGSKLVVTYNSKTFLEAQQAIQFRFKSYEANDVNAFLKAAGFDVIETTSGESMSNSTFFVQAEQPQMLKENKLYPQYSTIKFSCRIIPKVTI